MKKFDLGGAIEEPVTLAQLAFTRIKDAILDGQLEPGASISEPTFAQALGISRTSLREALFRLEAQGYAERGGTNRWQIFNITEDSARDIYECRGVLQGVASSLASLHATQADLLKLREQLDAAWAANAADDLGHVIECTTYFHELIIRYSGNEKLQFLLEILRPQLLLNRRLMLMHAKHRRSILSRNEDLLAALSAGDADLAQRIAINNAQMDLVAVLELLTEGRVH